MHNNLNNSKFYHNKDEKEIKTPLKKYFNNWYQANIITLSFELNKNDNQFKSGFFFEKILKEHLFFMIKKIYIIRKYI